MYPVILALHNILRWVALILVLAAFVRAVIGWQSKLQWTNTDRKLGMFASISIDIQLLLGLLLYFFLSPLTRTAFMDFGAAMGISELRFFAIEHGFYMLLALVFAHLGSILPRKVENSTLKFKRAALWFGLTLVVILAGIPWGRPLFPGL
jgi:hypothetical protein